MSINKLLMIQQIEKDLNKGKHIWVKHVEKDKITKQVPRCNTVSTLSTNCVGINPETPIINLAYCMLHKEEIDEGGIIPKQIIFANDEEIQTFMDCVEKIEKFYNKEATY